MHMYTLVVAAASTHTRTQITGVRRGTSGTHKIQSTPCCVYETYTTVNVRVFCAYGRVPPVGLGDYGVPYPFAFLVFYTARRTHGGRFRPGRAGPRRGSLAGGWDRASAAEVRGFRVPAGVG